MTKAVIGPVREISLMPEIARDVVEMAALKRLLKMGRGDSSGQTRVANFLLSWWDAQAMGGWNVRNAGCLEREIVEDMIIVIRLIERRNCHPSDLGFQQDFLEIARRHRNVE